MPSLENLNKEMNQDKFHVIGISVDEDKDLAEEFLMNHKISFANFHDGGRRVANQQLGVDAYPETFIIAPNGVIVKRIIGEQHWDSSSMIALLREISKADQNNQGSWAYGPGS